jgi:DNA-binding transcriptional ArsR family regulator
VFPRDDPAAFRFGLSRLSEVAFSMHALAKPKHHPAQHAWIRQAHAMSPELRREIRAFEFLFHDAVPDCLLPARTDLSFDGELEQLRSLDPERIAYELARPLFFYIWPAAGGPEALSEPGIRSRILWAASSHGRASAALGRMLYDDPRELAERLAALFRRYWDEGFGDEWERIQPRLEAALEAARSKVSEAGIWPLVEELQPPLVVDRSARRVARPSGHAHEVKISAETPLLLIPSVYVWPHVRVNCDPPWPLAIAYPGELAANGARREQPPDALVRALRAAADPTRLQTLRLIAEQPRTTEELAPLIGLSEAGMSKHLRALIESGLVRRRREGYYVLYSVERSRLDALGRDVVGFVDSGGGATAAAAAFRRAPRGPGT